MKKISSFTDIYPLARLLGELYKSQESHIYFAEHGFEHVPFVELRYFDMCDSDIRDKSFF